MACSMKKSILKKIKDKELFGQGYSLFFVFLFFVFFLIYGVEEILLKKNAV